MSKTASQKLLRDLNQRIGQLENEKSLMAKYMGRLEQQLAKREQTIYLLSNQQDMVQQQNKKLREAAQEFFNKEMRGAVEAYAAKDRLRRMVQESDDA